MRRSPSRRPISAPSVRSKCAGGSRRSRCGQSAAPRRQLTCVQALRTGGDRSRAFRIGPRRLKTSRRDLRQLTAGSGDHWVFGGALAIATLACARTTTALTATSTLPGLHGALREATLAIWAAALWLPALLAGELISPRLRYDTRRRSTVFPFGMYAVCSMAAGGVTGIDGVSTFGRIWIWIALAVWGVVFAGMIRRGVALGRR